MRLLLVEDDRRLSELIAGGLRRAGFSVDERVSADDAVASALAVRYELILLDLGLPDLDGMDVLADLRARKLGIPVLIITARGDLEDRVGALNAGADDYLVKPFDMAELVARIKALLRRPAGALGTVLQVGNLAFDTIAREARCGDRPLNLSRREMHLLEGLLRRAGHVVPKSLLEEHLYGAGDEGSANSVEVLAHRLRRKLADAGAAPTIHTVRGVGYLLTDDAGQT